MSALTFDGVGVRYGTGAQARTVINSVSLEVPAGTIVGLVGESGCGKSTLGKTAVGLVTPFRGRVCIDGEDVRGLPRRKRPVHMVFQDPYASLDPRMTIEATICEAMPRSITRAIRSKEARRLLEMVHLDPRFLAALPGEMSGGQRQRIALARALAAQPKVIVADEITSALDVSVQAAILNLVRELREELGLAILFVSHDLAVVRYVCDEVAVMSEGEIVEHGPVLDVIEHPQHPYTRTLLAAAGHPTIAEIATP